MDHICVDLAAFAVGLGGLGLPSKAPKPVHLVSLHQIFRRRPSFNPTAMAEYEYGYVHCTTVLYPVSRLVMCDDLTQQGYRTPSSPRFSGQSPRMRSR